MESTLLTLAQVVLPTEILKHFEIVNITSNPAEIHIYLDENKDSNLASDSNYESNLHYS